MFRVMSVPEDSTAPAAPATPVSDPAGGSNPLTGATETTLPGLATFKGLVLGLILGAIAFHRTLHERNLAEAGLRRASVAFMELLEERFGEWGLTPAERDVALFAIKGMSTAEIAVLRATSEGTVKAQTNAIYRKAGVTGRPQLLCLFIEELMRDDAAEEAQAIPVQVVRVQSSA